MPFPPPRWKLLLALVCLIVPGLALGAGTKPRRKRTPLVTLPGGAALRRDAARAFERMSSAARTEGVWLWVSSGYRTRRQQRFLYERYKQGMGPRAARPGQSNHQRGTAVDVSVGHEDTPTYRWLAANACRHGFRRTVPSEPWHWEYRPRTTPPPPQDRDCLGQPVTPREPPRTASSGRS
jgi:zinc D-Ala-D-Ala carboxypeptidase